MLRSDMSDLISSHADAVVIIQDYDDLGSQTEILLGGKLQTGGSSRYQNMLLINWINDGEETFTLAMGNDQYDMTEHGIRRVYEPYEELDEQLIRDLRYWIQTGVTRWSKASSNRMARRWRKI